MDDDEDGQAPPQPMTAALRYLAGLDAAASGNAQAFGFSIVITVTFGVVSAANASPTRLQLLGFALAAVAAFSALNLATAGLTRRHPDDGVRKRVLLVATAPDFVAVGLAVRAAIGVVSLASGWAAWTLAPCASAVAYVLVQGLELAVARDRADAEQEQGQGQQE